MDDFTRLKQQTLARHLGRNIAGEVRFDVTSRRLYSTDASIYQIEPLGVVIPRTVEDIRITMQVAGEMRVPITARGGGTSLSGQSIGPGVVVDCSKYLNKVLDIDPAARVARVQPGVVLDHFNRALASHGLQFGPDVATASRANLCGMIGNNSAGARSIVYGKTIDHVRELKVVLANATECAFGAISNSEWDRRAQYRSVEGDLYRTIRQIIQANVAEIRKRFPKLVRRVSGYNLDVICEAFHGDEPRPVGVHQLIVGSEGTLAFVTEAELGLVPLPRHRGLLVLHFESLAAAMNSVWPCLELAPSAVELLDELFIDLARRNHSLQDTVQLIQGHPAALLMVEFSSDDAAEVADRVQKLARKVRGISGLTAAVPALEREVREPLWDLRRAAMPLLYGMPGDRKPITFVEDTAVDPGHLPEFVARFKALLHSHGTDGAFYGHVSVGCLHIRPMLNLKDPDDVGRMRRIAEDVTSLVREFDGALSGEHGDGLARSEWNRRMFGTAVYEAFRDIKRAFDPENLLNPGKVVDAPPMTDNLRYHAAYHPREPLTVFHYGAQQGFIRSIEQCNGSGVCRKLDGGTMCPSFRATLDEKDSTRGRANVLRMALADGDPLTALQSRDVYDVLDLCLQCKACKSECPANVDMAKLKAEFLHFHYRKRMRPMGDRLVANIHRFNTLASSVAPLVNWVQERAVVRWLMEKLTGLDRRRSLPELHRDHFRRWFAAHTPAPAAGSRGRVLLLDDCLTTFNEPSIGAAGVRLLERAGYAVQLANLACCCRPMISKGFLTEARALIQQQAPKLASRLAEGTALLGLEPSCILTLADEWPELVKGSDTQRIALAAEFAESWLARQVRTGNTELKLKPRGDRCVVHGHCHQKALRGAGGTIEALRLVPQLDVQLLETGCCGMAGSFGMEHEHFDLSTRIAGLTLLPALEDSPGATVVSPGTSCRHQIRDLAGRKAVHPLELLAEQMED
jgi:FAD/FMN-containing dehydrogenase/Fe-S oxidoreductase